MYSLLRENTYIYKQRYILTVALHPELWLM